MGYVETVEALRVLTGVDVPLNRKLIKMQPGDEALVFRIAFPPGAERPDPAKKGNIGVGTILIFSEFGILKRKK